MPITANKTVRELAVKLPNATRVFEKLGIDYCCGGQKSLEEACAAANVSVEDTARALEQGGTASTAAERDWNTAAIGDLVDHIIDKHHTYVKAEIPRVQALITNLHDPSRVHGAGARAGFAAHDHPIDSFKIQAGQRS